MIRSLYIAKTGLEAQQTNLDVISNNLANVSTNGFKRSRAVFEDLLYQNVRQPGAQSSQQTALPSGMQTGHRRAHRRHRAHPHPGQSPVHRQRQGLDDQRLGLLQRAAARWHHRPTPATARFQSDSNGQMVTSSGYVIQPAITIPANATVDHGGPRRRRLGDHRRHQRAPTQIGTLQVTTFVNPAGLESKGENLYVETGSSGSPNTNTPGTNGAGVVMQGYVETSNVNVVEEMVNMIQTQRAYEINSKAITTSDQMLAKLSQI